MNCRFSIVAVMVCAALSAHAAEANVATPSATWALLRVVGALALVFAIFFGGAWLFRHWQRLAVRRGRPSRLAVLEIKSLGPRHALYVVAYEQQRLLLATSPAGVTMLTPLPEGEAVPAEPLAPAPSFTDVLFQAIARKT